MPGWGALIPYTVTDTTLFFPSTGNYGAADLNNGDAGDTTTMGTGLNAIVSPGTFTLTLSATSTVGYIAIYDGYTDRNDGTYTSSLTSGGTTTNLGSYTIKNNATTGTDTQNNDNILFQLNTPLSAGAVNITYAQTAGDTQNTASFREIQIFAVPEPGTYALLLGGAGLLLVLRARSVRRA